MDAVTLSAESVSGRTEEEKLANIALSPEFKAAVASKAYAPAIGEQDLAAVLQRLGEVTSRVASGDTKDVESMLPAQALTLDSIFHKPALQAGAMQINIDMENAHVDRRAQSKNAVSDSRVEALGEIYGGQNPRGKSCLQQERTETRNVFS